MGVYRSLGVDPEKRAAEIFRRMLKPLYPRAFAPVVGSPWGDGLVLHVDGAGSKPIVSYICYKELGGEDCFQGLAQDVVAMNLDDAAAVGAAPLLFADYVAINPLRLSRESVLRAVSRGLERTAELLRSLSARGKPLSPALAGGETADLPDQVRTLDIVGVLLARVDLERAVTCERISEGDVIVGLRSGGRALHEERENSGIMCNGLTLARRVLLTSEYSRMYPETLEPLSTPYAGRFRLEDEPEDLGMSVGDALLSPTRIYAPIVFEILERCGEMVKCMVHNTGGGLAKILRVGSGARYVKDSLPEPDPVFKLIQREGRLGDEEMYRVFNMGIGFEVIVGRECAEEAIRASEKMGIGASVIGRILRGSPGWNELVIETPRTKILLRSRAA